jgi:hypothetical protein
VRDRRTVRPAPGQIGRHGLTAAHPSFPTHHHHHSPLFNAKPGESPPFRHPRECSRQPPPCHIDPHATSTTPRRPRPRRPGHVEDDHVTPRTTRPRRPGHVDHDHDDQATSTTTRPRHVEDDQATLRTAKSPRGRPRRIHHEPATSTTTPGRRRPRRHDHDDPTMTRPRPDHDHDATTTRRIDDDTTTTTATATRRPLLANLTTSPPANCADTAHRRGRGRGIAQVSTPMPLPAQQRTDRPPFM